MTCSSTQVNTTHFTSRAFYLIYQPLNYHMDQIRPQLMYLCVCGGGEGWRQGPRKKSYHKNVIIWFLFQQKSKYCSVVHQGLGHTIKDVYYIRAFTELKPQNYFLQTRSLGWRDLSCFPLNLLWLCEHVYRSFWVHSRKDVVGVWYETGASLHKLMVPKATFYILPEVNKRFLLKT